MKIRADYDPRYFRRFLYIALGCVAFAIWCFYDALVAYPRELVRSEAYWTASPDTPGEYIAMEREPWRTLVREKGWSTDPPEKPGTMAQKIVSQYFYAGICLLVGIPLLLKWVLARGSWLEADEEQLTTSWGPAFRFDQVREIDKTRWEKKGITRVRYDVDGQLRTFSLDDFKFLREPLGRILFSLEQTLSDAQITGGPREAGPQSQGSSESNPAESADQPAAE